MNRTRYLLARLEWKREYIVIQQRIRAAKQGLRGAHRAYGLQKAKLADVYLAISEIRNARLAMEEHLKKLWALKDDARRAWEERQ